MAGSTLVYIANLPEDQECEKVQDDGETLYLCDGVLYRATYYQDKQVYEIVSDAEEEAEAEPASAIGLALTSPMTTGEIVRDLQNRLVAQGYDVGTIDGVFGTGTETAILWLQYDNELEQTGYVDRDTAKLLGFDVPEIEDDRPPADGAAPAEGGEAEAEGDTGVAEDAPADAAAEDAPSDDAKPEDAASEDAASDTAPEASEESQDN
ncbi:peptidoglycan-binding domain-containing protein [Shimia sp.]|uniref:peptidoglycan-binding domain-containing protein n=1 Tax=Shimia sp. TaxID=1954381 RepID=UPI00329A05FF